MTEAEAIKLLLDLKRHMQRMQAERLIAAKQDVAFQTFLRYATHRYVP